MKETPITSMQGQQEYTWYKQGLSRANQHVSSPKVKGTGTRKKSV